MSEGNISEEEVYRFILERIDTVPHLEALLLLWNSRPGRWSEREASERLFIDVEVVRTILQDLARQNLIAAESEPQKVYWYQPEPAADQFLAAVAEIYRRELVRVSTLIHSKASSAVREFARAFKFTKERE